MRKRCTIENHNISLTILALFFFFIIYKFLKFQNYQFVKLSLN